MSKVQLDDLTPNNLGMLKRINAVVLPTTYTDSFYQEALTVGQLAKLAYYNEIPVGAIRCCLEVPQEHTKPSRIYIMTIAVLAPYRENGIGGMLLDHIEQYAREEKVPELSVHALTDDADVLEWYKKRGFEVVDEVKGYYKRLTPAKDAFLMVKKLE
ncbi:putative N-acetyltransferase san [Yarrowia sp. B02]|nr:putative N-acetyltransferase san [Yarrowia sp. B02]